MQKHLTTESKSINDSFTLPVLDVENPITQFDKDTLLSTIIRRYSTLPVLYDDPDWFYDECECWWDENKFAFAKMWQAIEQEYDPLRNYDRNEHSTETPYSDLVTHSGTDTEGHSGTDSNTKTGTETAAKTGHDDLERQGKTISDTDTLAKSREVAENKVSAYNESNYQNSSKSEVHKEYDIDGEDVPDNVHSEVSHENDKDVQTYGSTDTITHNTVDATVHGETITNTYNSTIATTHIGNAEHDLHSFGNIGITTSQHMLEKELLLRKTYNLYKIMANTFADDLCLGIW